MTKTTQFDLISIAGRHWKLIVGVTVACVALSVLITQVLPHRYSSEMKFLVNNERTDLVISPGNDKAMVVPSEVSETQVNSEIELMKSRDILEGIVMDYKLYAPYQGKTSGPPTRKSIERASNKLEKHLSVSALRKTNIINVSYSGSDPEKVVAILQAIGDRYLSSHLLAHGAPGTDKFFSDQVAVFKQRFADAQAALGAFHRKEQIFSLPQQQTALVDRLERVSAQLKDVDGQIHVSEARLGESARQLSGIPDRTVTQLKQSSNQIPLQQLEPLLAQLQNRRIELANKFQPTDRFVTEIDAEIASTQKQIAQIRAEHMDEQTTDVDPLHQSIQSDSTRSEIDLTGLRAQRTQLELERQDVLRQLGGLDQSSAELQDLEQAAKEAQDNYQLYSRRLDEVRLANALDRERFSNVVMIERPAVSPLPVSPNPQLNLAVGLIFGLCLSFALAFMSDLRKPPLTSPEPAVRGQRYPETLLRPMSGD